MDDEKVLIKLDDGREVELDKKLTETYYNARKLARFVKIGLIPFILLTIGLCILIVYLLGRNILVVLVYMVFLTLILVEVFMSVRIRDDAMKRGASLKGEILRQNFSAQEIFEIGKKVHLDTFKEALDKRAIVELKLKKVPQWCIEGRILPDAEMIKERRKKIAARKKQ